MMKRLVLAFVVASTAGACSGLAAPTPSPTAGSASQAASTQAPSQATAPTAALTSATVVPSTTPTAAPTGESQEFGDGTFVVGKDIQPGTYRARVPSPGCYWARLSGFGGYAGDVIANEATGASTVVTISASDKGFYSDMCGTWTTDLSAILSLGSPIPAGTYIVGTDMTPGTYRSAAGPVCRWARLTGFGGANEEVIADGGPSTGAIVTITGSDKGFRSSRCEAWTRQ